MYKLLTLAFILLIFFGCGNDKLDTPNIPENIELDIDQDGNPDFIVTYAENSAGDPIGSYQIINMTLESRGNNQILKNEDEQPIFINDIALIQTQVSLPFYWEVSNPSANVSFPVARIRTEYNETTWGDSWLIHSLEVKESYLIGVKLSVNNTTQVGFIEFSVDSQTGDFILFKAELL